MLKYINYSILLHLLWCSLLWIPWEKIYIPQSLTLNARAKKIWKNPEDSLKEKLVKLWEEYERSGPQGSGGFKVSSLAVSNGSLNPNAQFTDALSEIEVLSAPSLSFGEAWSKEKGCGNDLALEGVGLSGKLIEEGVYQVQEISPHSPAFKAGMKKGDLIKGDFFSLRGPQGSKVWLKYYRGKKVFKKLVKRQIICYKLKN